MAAETYYHNLIQRLSANDPERAWAKYLSKSAAEQIRDGLYVGPIQRLTVARFKKAIRKLFVSGHGSTDIDLVAGGPPCQGYSTAGRRNPLDVRNRMPDYFLRFVGWLNPKAVLIENVAGFRLAFQRDGHAAGASAVLERLRKIGKQGYVARLLALNASHYGVPQSRPRSVIIGLRRDIAEQLGITDETIWHSEPNMEESEDLDLRAIPTSCTQKTVRDAFYGLSLESSNDQYVRLLSRELPVPTVGKVKNAAPPPNHRLRRHCERVEQRFRLYQILREMKIDESVLCQAADDAEDGPVALSGLQRAIAGCDGFPRRSNDARLVVRTPDELVAHILQFATKKHSQRALGWDKPSYTVMTLPDDLVHPSEPRTLTVREMARLQSFPDEFEFMGKETTGGQQRKVEVPQYTQVGNAVPPLLARALGLHIAKLLDAASGDSKEE